MSATNPSQASVVRARYWTIAAARIVCVVWIVREAQPLWDFLVSRVQSVLNGHSGNWSFAMDQVAQLAFPIAGLCVTPWIVKRVLPLASATCPQCGYAITRNQNPCPECGLQLES
jgi:hypothetical protein